MWDFVKTNQQGVRLFLLVLLTLYLELALIRFSSAEVLYLGYFSNFILISVFLGIGLGFLMTNHRFDLFKLAPVVLFAFIVLLTRGEIDATQLRDNVGQLFFGFGDTNLKMPLWLSLALIFSMTVYLFAAIAQQTGRCFKHYSPLAAYSIDIGGSLAGIVLFTTHSYLGGNPVQWFIVVGVLAVILSVGKIRILTLIMSVLVVLLIHDARPDHYQTWSPYQRIDVQPMNDGYRLLANGIGHQTMQPVGHKEAVYDYAYTELLHRLRRDMWETTLVIGSGSGTDVSYALHYGVGHVDAVEIDPEILRAGQQFHPAQPYSDERVDVNVTDGRAFMERTDNRYDLVIFALPDSLASFSNLANIRLESFLFTVESFQQARELLNPDGVLILYNYYRREWLVGKLACMLSEVFGHSPIIQTYNDERGGMLAAVVIGEEITGDELICPDHLTATDDWPFLYMYRPHLPPMYLGIMALFVVSGLLGVVLTGHAKKVDVRRNGPFFLMGAAFLLLETKSIIQFSLIFGATWLVNSLVFFAILLSVLLANLIASRLRLKSSFWLFALLFVSLIVQMSVPLSALLGIESFAIRYTLASLILFSPIFCANLVFGFLFRDTKASATAFGWNLIGTMIGGALEYSSLKLGYQTLAVIVAVLYLVCAVWALRISRENGREE